MNKEMRKVKKKKKQQNHGVLKRDIYFLWVLASLDIFFLNFFEMFVYKLNKQVLL